MNWHCKIGKVTPRLALHRDSGAVEPDFWNDGGFVEDLIRIARNSGAVTSYAVVATNDKGTATVGTRSGCTRTNLQMIGALVVETVRQAEALDGAS